ncbi:hypothetical protein KI688_003064 [Linnemannia hyalina]|uniref:Myb-like domain-containing protein n=1 Tax=Linnemannia hyalina TaxID=64524 RepID=A0A9P7XP64_9FUNG|nr:hypothetical protein KI688_003064 [Linnemannia hyalina]
MTSSDMDETIASSPSYVSVDLGQHKKRSSSTMSPPSAYENQHPRDMSIDSTHPNATSNSNNDNDNEGNMENFERPLKQTFRQLTPIDTTSHRHWSNAEQEALYVAVERHHLYGRWADVKERMQLDRSLEEIEQEYTRIYGELPESDIDYDDDDDDDWSSSGYDPAPGSAASSTGPTYRSSFPNLYHAAGGAATPALTPATQSRRSSQEMYGSYPYPHSTQSTSRRPSNQTNRSMHSRSPDEGYDHDHDGGSDTRMRDRDSSYHAPSPTTPKSRGTGSSGKRGRGGGSAAAAADRAATAAAAAARGVTGGDGGDAKPTRTVRVWTLQQSEQLKNLIETCFPGGYRINWVWVASQMGNTFTRKQCKNKWEIMRRRAGTDEEIAQLKRGYEEFGPSWSQIQEKYLPERSQGGISIMWGLLLAREEEEERKQQQQQSSSSSSGRDMSVDHVSPTAGSSGLGLMTPVSPSRSRKEGSSAGATFPSHTSTSSVASPTGYKRGASRRPSMTTPPYGASSRHHWPPVE